MKQMLTSNIIGYLNTKRNEAMYLHFKVFIKSPEGVKWKTL